MRLKPKDLLEILDDCLEAESIPKDMLRRYQEWREMLCDKINQKCSLSVYGKVNGVIVQRLMPLSFWPESQEQANELAFRCLARGLDMPIVSLYSVCVIKNSIQPIVLSDEKIHACIIMTDEEDNESNNIQ